ncbi:MAG: bifunctional GTP diphosphokinase/guanosine-3',5'-bis pyrophosphate 3'-pyrophosphohydrolase [Marinospirillum sp.]|uniref:bifunctional GTP diphosphokinase/guanosine-3',5'-bis pyrophosphate 3'-pyrophosphohydrolase n=1 Tax=Marinospirillum sp. TaxID=2183934 RepID=UPI0019D82165|nr:bifunctional GTP diphosphokinase/guanosine-3',5'-bis pyrophosphate 3'-pyrophosphohydrolase [Marinospirillum sp.]MBE0505250.1 bifunctional GTP diphosphokinase/guanosine-3',5'-bis pyrophosphate 3'-pyrophosphohydrolase [Marinospirillum sp.]
MNTIDDLCDRLKGYLPADEIQQVRRAYFYAEQAHDGQKRSSGEPYVTHPLAVATILANLHLDHQALIAALLHDVIEDTGISKEAVARQFGDAVAELVDGVSKLTQIKFESKAEAQAENFRKMVLAMAEDIRVIIVKLADRLHNMRTLGALRADKKRRIARETLDIYAPIANRLGINTLRLELEDLSFQAIYPMRYERLRRAVQQVRGHRKEVVKKIQQRLQERLEQDGLKGRVVGREKNLLSLYRKMKHQKKSFSDIMDVYAFRIMTETVDDCYRVLGTVHNTYKPVPGRFKDYVAIPKANGYQSLHTSLFGLSGIPIEVQIRTRDMEAMANNGVAAHWLYKAGQTDRPIAEGSHARARQWVKGLLEMQQRAGDSLEFIEHVKVDLFPDEIYIFTPSGEIMELPKGSTPVDFAYAVHTDVGNGCVACRIDRKLAPLSARLQSGQTVEVITAPGARPNLAWLSFVTTAKARSAIRHFIKQQQRSESEVLGRRLLDKALAQFDVRLELIPEERLKPLLQEMEVTSIHELLEAIGLGQRMAYVVARRLLSEAEAAVAGKAEESSMIIHGTEGMVVSFARCCRPIPGDSILGHISFGSGIVVHRDNCRNLSEIRDNPDKCVTLRWAEKTEGDFNVNLKLEIEHQRGIIARIATLVTEMDASLERISVDERDARLSTLTLEVLVANRIHLARIMKKLRLIPEVNRVVRLR